MSPLERRIASIIRGKLAEQRRKHAEMADAIGVSRNHMSRMLNSRIHIDVNHLAAMAEFVGMRPVELIAQAEGVEPPPARDALHDDLHEQVGSAVQVRPYRKQASEAETDVG